MRIREEGWKWVWREEHWIGTLAVYLFEPLMPLSFLGKGTRGILPTHPNKGTNYFNYGVIAESCVN